MIFNTSAGGSSTIDAEAVTYEDTTVAEALATMETDMGGLTSIGAGEIVATMYEPNTITMNKPLTDYRFVYIELMLDGLSLASRLIPVSRVLYGSRFNVTFNNDLRLYNAQVGFTDANTVTCGIFTEATLVAVYGIK
jgi:hypothetical protein